MLVKTEIQGRYKDVPLTEVNVRNYICPEGEEHCYHCIIEIKRFNQLTGKRLSAPRLQKFGRKAYEGGVYESLKRQGYSVDVVHDPVKWEAAHAEEQAAAKAKAEAEAKAKAEAARAAEVDAAVAKALEAKEAETQPRIDAAVAKALEAKEAETQPRIDAAVAKALEAKEKKTKK